MNAFITAQGFAKTGMYSVLIGAVINIILDPIFIFACHMGVRGAALAPNAIKNVRLPKNMIKVKITEIMICIVKQFPRIFILLARFLYS